MKTTISFSELSHTGHSCNAVPYGVALVAAYALKHFGDTIEARLFKDPTVFGEYLEKTPPRIACFSSYIWNTNLSLAYAKQLKQQHPDTVTVFGGPNYPIVEAEQEAFLLAHPEIDFYVFRDGEEAFVKLLEALQDADCRIDAIKKDQLKIPSCHYIADGKMVAGDLMPLIADLNDLPSPYLSGLCDEFLKTLVPLTQTTRGCPFRCTFCQDGDDYAKLVRRRSPELIREELEYIAQRAATPQLYLTDLNFGMYKQDLETCRVLADTRNKYGWPHSIDLNGKNQKDRVLEATRIVEESGDGNGAVTLVAAIQSTDPAVLGAVKRDNVRSADMLDLAKEGEAYGSNSFSEVILALPGDSKEAHIQSIHDLMDCNINVVRSHQFIMLNGADASTQASRDHFAIKTRYRVTPKTVVPYTLFGETFFCPEIDEICVENSTLSFQDYLDSRTYDLTVEIFYNYGLFLELFRFLRAQGQSIPAFITRIHEKITSGPGPLTGIYEGFLRETNEIWDSEQEVLDFLEEPGVKERYMNGELGNNEQLMYRALAIFRNMDDLHRIAFETAAEILAEQGLIQEHTEGYLKELSHFSLLRKKDMLSVEEKMVGTFHYDFIKLEAANFNDDPLKAQQPDGISISFAHSEDQKELIDKYVKVYGLEKYGLGHVLGSATHVSNFYRMVEAS